MLIIPSKGISLIFLRLLFIILETYQKLDVFCLSQTLKSWFMLLFPVDWTTALLFAGLKKPTLHKLQRIQNAAARVLTKRFEHITPILSSLHWLPVKQRIDFKILLIVFKCCNGLAPSYVADMLTKYTPGRSFSSSDKELLAIPRINSKSAHGAFSHYGPTLWISLPHEVRSATTVSSFKRKLKTCLFSRAFSYV